jgi:hypothetical protein
LIPADALFHERRKVLDPAEKRRVIDRDATLAHHVFKVAVADPKFAIPAHAQQNHVGRKTAAFEIGHGGDPGEAPSISLRGSDSRRTAAGSNVTKKRLTFLSDKGYVPPNGKRWVDRIRTKGNQATLGWCPNQF